MSGRPLPSSGDAAAQNELLAKLGLPPSSSPEDVDQLHQAVSQYLAAAPSGIRGWAHAQSSALDAAYLTLTDPVGLQGSALRSSTRPPTVVPGGPATPPARRDPVPADPFIEAAAVAEVAATEADADASADVDTDDLDALYASVTPSAHRDMLPGAAKVQPAKPVAATAAATGSRRRVHKTQTRAAAPVAPPASSGPWKSIAIAVTGVLAIVLVVGVVIPFVGNLGGSTANGANPSANTAAQASPTAPAVDLAKIAALMATLQAKPNDPATLLALGDEYYAGQQFDQAATFYDKLLAVDAKNIKGLLARGAVYFNANDLTNAAKLWNQVVAIEPNNQEVHYDLGFLAMNQASPDWASVQAEWTKVVKIDATTSLAKLVQQHLDSLVQASMIPGPSGSPSASGSPAPASSSSASPASPSASPAPSASPSGSAKP
jgi:cytochrome c-type biogenesis protein CcmH/NrfG